MAQWAKQFSGYTHETRIADAEEQLQRAIASFRAASPGHDQAKCLATVQRLAERTLAARLHALKARLVAARSGGTAQAMNRREKQITSLTRRLAESQSAGIVGVLKEHGITP